MEVLAGLVATFLVWAEPVKDYVKDFDVKRDRYTCQDFNPQVHFGIDEVCTHSWDKFKR